MHPMIPLWDSVQAQHHLRRYRRRMEAALRTAVETLTGEELKALDFTEVRGTAGIKEATYNVAGMDVKVAVASALIMPENFKQGKIRRGVLPLHRDHGMPRRLCKRRRPASAARLRAGYRRYPRPARQVLYNSDKANTIRKSHENPAIKELYASFLGEPGSEKAHHLLHTSYVKRRINGN